jgi:hypothetical protein
VKNKGSVKAANRSCKPLGGLPRKDNKMFNFLKPKIKVNIEPRCGYLVLVDANGKVLKKSQSNRELRKWAKDNGYEMRLGNGIDQTPFPVR